MFIEKHYGGKNSNSSEIPLSKHEFSQIRIIVLLLFNSEIFIAEGEKKRRGAEGITLLEEGENNFIGIPKKKR